MIRLDAFLLDRVAQPIANWLEPWCTPFQVARWAACGGAIGWFVAAFHSFVMDHGVASAWDGFALVVLPVFTLAVFSTIADAERACRRPGVMNPERLTHCGPRIAMLATSMLALLDAPLPPRSFATSVVSPLGCACWTVCFYFRACQMPWPRPRRARVPVGAALGGAA